MASFYQMVSYAGVREDMSVGLQKQLTLTNRINFFMALLGIVEVSQFMLSGNYLKGSIILLPWLMTVAIPLLNQKGLHVLTRYLTAIGYPTYNIVSNLYYKSVLVESGPIPFLEELRPSLTLLVYLLIPLAIFDPVTEKRRLRLCISLLIVYNLGYDALNDYFGLGVMASDWQSREYGNLLIFKGVLVAAIIAIVASIKRVNHVFERKLKASNQKLQIQSEEILSQNEELQQQKEEISAQREAISQKNSILTVKNRQVEDSVRAAESIQQAILPYQEELKALMPNYFLIYRPKDIVSGDFYWAGTASGYSIIAVIDCTGHGVPGAFMTLVASTLLDKIIKLKRQYSPKKILQELDGEIKGMLKQEENRNRSGMEMSVCTWKEDENGNTNFSFSGARSNIFIYEHSNQLLKLYKGSRRGIGGRQSSISKEYEEHTMTLEPGTKVYAYTDGYLDQNNPERQRLGANTFRGLLEKVAAKDMQEQKLYLIQTLEKHQAGEEQRDDICVLGFEV